MKLFRLGSRDEATPDDEPAAKAPRALERARLAHTSLRDPGYDDEDDDNGDPGWHTRYQLPHALATGGGDHS